MKTKLTKFGQADPFHPELSHIFVCIFVERNNKKNITKPEPSNKVTKLNHSSLNCQSN